MKPTLFLPLVVIFSANAVKVLPTNDNPPPDYAFETNYNINFDSRCLGCNYQALDCHVKAGMCLIDGHCQNENDIHAKSEDGTNWLCCPNVTQSAWTPIAGSQTCTGRQSKTNQSVQVPKWTVVMISVLLAVLIIVLIASLLQRKRYRNYLRYEGYQPCEMHENGSKLSTNHVCDA